MSSASVGVRASKRGGGNNFPPLAPSNTVDLTSESFFYYGIPPGAGYTGVFYPPTAYPYPEQSGWFVERLAAGGGAPLFTLFSQVGQLLQFANESPKLVLWYSGDASFTDLRVSVGNYIAGVPNFTAYLSLQTFAKGYYEVQLPAFGAGLGVTEQLIMRFGSAAFVNTGARAVYVNFLGLAL